MSEEKPNNTKLFRQIVREFNEKTGFNFQLPKDADYSSKYAHPVHEEGNIRLRGQIDDNDGKPKPTRSIYAISAQVEGVGFSVHDINHEQFMKLLNHDVFKYKLGVLRQLKSLASELSGKINLVEASLTSDAVSDIEKEENYDLATKTARTLYKTS